VGRLSALGLRTWANDADKSEWVVIPAERVSGRRILTPR
jgi:hypothetical protein